MRFQPGEVEPPVDATGGTLSAMAIVDPALRDSLEGMGVTRLERLLPGFHHEDVNAFNAIGEPVVLQDAADIYVAYFNSGLQVEAAVGNLDNEPSVLFAETDDMQHITQSAPVIPDDPFFADQWDLDATGQTMCGSFTASTFSDINAPEAWSTTTGSSAIPVAVLDSGIDDTHVELDGRVVLGPNQNFVTPAASAFDDDPEKHGTAVAGIIGATGFNNFGIAGVNWNVPLKAIKITNATGYGQPSWLGGGIDWVRTNNVPIANMSVGFKAGAFSPTVGTMQALNTICYNAFRQGVLLVAPMGNENGTTALYPAAFSKRVCAVGATWLSGTRWDDSNIIGGVQTAGSTSGPWIDLAAPGGRMMVTLDAGPDGFKDLSMCDPMNVGSMAFGGTSASAPVVSGVASLLRAIRTPPGTVLMGEDMQKIMELTAFRPSGSFNQQIGWGIVHADAALAFIDPATRLVHQGSLGQGGTEGALAPYDSAVAGTLTLTNVPGLPTPYNCNSCIRYHMRGTTTFSWGYSPAPVVWTRSSGTEGWKDTTAFDYNVEIPSSRLVAAPTTTQATFETTVYRVPGIGWFPTTPSGARVAYTAVGTSNLIGVGESGPSIQPSLRIMPNPSVGRSSIRLSLPKAENVSVAIYDVAGRKVADMGQGVLSEGEHTLPWAGTDERGVKCRAGVYWVRVSGPTTRMQKSLVLLRAGGS